MPSRGSREQRSLEVRTCFDANTYSTRFNVVAAAAQGIGQSNTRGGEFAAAPGICRRGNRCRCCAAALLTRGDEVEGQRESWQRVSKPRAP